MLVDLHVHLSAAAPLDALAARAKEVGLDGLALVGSDAFADPGPTGHDDFVILSGAEVATERGRYLVFLPPPACRSPMDELFGPKEGGVRPVRDLLLRVKALGGAAVAAHPYDLSVEHPGGDILFTLPGLTAIEVVFAGRPPIFSAAAVEAADILGLPGVGGSGAGRPDELGRAATLFAERVEGEEQLVAALKAGACWPVDFLSPPPALGRSPQATAER